MTLRKQAARYALAGAIHVPLDYSSENLIALTTCLDSLYKRIPFRTHFWLRLVTLQGAVWSCVLNETALVAATASADFSAKVWNALTGDETHSFKHEHICRTLAFATATPRLLTAGKLSTKGRPSLLPYRCRGPPCSWECCQLKLCNLFEHFVRGGETSRHLHLEDLSQALAHFMNL